MKELITRFIVLLISVGALIFVCFTLINRGTESIMVDYKPEEILMTESTAVDNNTSDYITDASNTDTEDDDADNNQYEQEQSVNTTVPDESMQDNETELKTVITSRVRKEYDNNSVYIDMENILQLPELPVGCEITALTILLNHYGFDADKTDLAKNYLPRGVNYAVKDGKVYKDSFFDYFIGDPFSRGYGCFANAIEKAANSFINDSGGGYTVLNISGSDPDILYDYLADGIPVLCWATDGMIEPEYYESWYDYETGENLDWYLNEHCFVLAGFNMSAGIVTLNDPMKGIIDYNINKFETRYDQMYKQAIVILKDEPENNTEETTGISENNEA